MVSLNPTSITLTQEWSIGKPVDQGGFGKVFLAQSVDEPSAVAKFVPKEPGASRELLFENPDGMPNVVPILDKGEWDGYWVLVMPRADKSLKDYMEEMGGHLSVTEATRVLTDIAEALSAIDGRIVHRDIKPANVLLLKGEWCLADFGISRYAEATTAPDTHKYYMTASYAAPEQWRGDRATGATDVYALGIVGYELLAGRRPFEGPDYRNQHLQATPTPISGIPAKLQSLIAACLNKSMGARPTAQSLLRRLAGTGSNGSDAQRLLQEANEVAAQRQAEVARQLSVEQSEAERRVSLGRDASNSWDILMQLLQGAVEEGAPDSTPSPGLSRWSWSLNEANLTVMPFTTLRGPVDLPFELIAYSSIQLLVPDQEHRYAGRSHSLWYCDAQEAGVFRWYETAFWLLANQTSALEPFALNPGRDADRAILPGMHTFQIARPFVAIDQGSEDEFIERWIGWFAQAALGKLRRPNHMPEQNPAGSWRNT